MINTKNVLIIGRTGGGKSALGNLLINKEKNLKEGRKFEEFFTESDSSVSETREIKSKEVKIEGMNYRIIDTIGIGNTKLTDKEIAQKIFRACYELEGGINQVIFIIE